MIAHLLTRLVALSLVLLVGACGYVGRTGPPPPGTQAEIAALADGIRALGPQVDPDEAARAARIAYEETYRLALAYEITDPPLIHNHKVNRGLKPRGLCWHWAEDLENRLKREDFDTLTLHRAIANADSKVLIDHSTTIVSARGDGMNDGIVLDPWRKGGVLFWAPIVEDLRYDWQPRMEVLRRHGRIRYIRQGAAVTP